MTDKDNNLEKIRIGCFGESNVGKTYFSRKYINDPNIDFSLPTIGIDYFTRIQILSNGKKYKIMILDTAGQERFRSISMTSIRSCNGFILMYDITNRETFRLISKWLDNIFEIKDKDFPFILIGNKYDLKDKREVSEEEGLEAAKKYNTTYFETSAKKGINVEKAVNELINKIITKKEEKSENKKEKEEENMNNNIQLSSQKIAGKKKKKC